MPLLSLIKSIIVRPEIDMDEMITYVEKLTGISPIIIATIFDAEEMFLKLKGVIE